MTELNQRHHLVLLFTDLTDSTRIAASLEPEQYAELLQQLRALTATIIARHGGEIARIDGDGALCIFGYPLAHEDAGRRATEAALDLHAATAELATSMGGGSAISLHSGIHAGVVLLRSGDLVRGRYEMLGDATNVAARLCDQAGADGILVSESTLGSDRHFFTTGPVRQISLAGHRETMPALHILGREDVPHRFATREKLGLTPFVGRQKERSVVAAWLAGSAPVMLVHGPAGIGKSRLLGQIASDAEARGYRILRGYCESYLGARPLQPLLQVAQSLGYDDVANGAIGPNDIVASLDRARGERLLVLIDDWQWADDASRDLMQRLIDGERADNRRWLLFSRGEDPRLGPEVNAASLALPPLGSSDAERAVANLLRSPDPFVTRRIEAAAGGSPLLIEELCHAFQASGKTPDKDPRGAWFDLAVQARFARLDAADGQLLREAAVIGHMVPGWLLAALRNEPVSGAVLARLQAADFLFPGDSGDTLRFKHGLTRDAIYAGIGFNDRKALHTRVLAVLERRAEAQGEAALLDALAYHAVAAGEVAKGLELSLSAGAAALLAGAFDRAQSHHLAAFRSYIATSPDGPAATPLSEIISRYGRSCVIDPSRDQLPVLAEMIDLAQSRGDRRARELALFWSGSVRFSLGDVKIASRHFEEALLLADPIEQPGFVAQLRASIGECCYDSGDLQRAIDLISTAVDALAEGLTEGRRMAYLYALANLGQIHGDRGDFAMADATFARIDAMLGDQTPPISSSLLVQRAAVSVWRQRYDEAAMLAELGETLARRDRSRQNTMIGRAVRSYASFMAGGDPEALTGLIDMLIWMEGSAYRHRSSLYFGWGADAMARIGDEAATRRYAARALSLARLGDSIGEATAARAMARLVAKGGRGQAPGYYLAIAHCADARRGSAWGMAESQRLAEEIGTISPADDANR